MLVSVHNIVDSLAKNEIDEKLAVVHSTSISKASILYSFYEH